MGTTMMTTKQLRDEISNACDGPVTAFVIISRAAKFASAGQDADRVANALFEELMDHGYLSQAGEDDGLR